MDGRKILSKPQNWITINSASSFSEVSVSELMQEINAGNLIGVNNNGRYWISRVDLQAWLDRRFVDSSATIRN